MGDLGTWQSIISISVALGGILLSGITTFVVMRVKINALLASQNESDASLKAAWARIESLKSAVKLLEQRFDVISGMMRPDKLEEHHIWKARIDTEMRYVRRDLDELRKQEKSNDT